MDGKKSAAPQPGDFPNDVEGQLAEVRETLRRAAAELTEEQNRQNRSREFMARVDKDWEERRIQSREFGAALHKSVMGILSRVETKATDAVHPDKQRKSARNKYAQFWNKRFEGLHPSQMRKTEKYLNKAGLTIAERDCYYLKIGYGKTFAEIASRMGYKHHSTAQEHFEKARAKVEERNS